MNIIYLGYSIVGDEGKEDCSIGDGGDGGKS